MSLGTYPNIHHLRKVGDNEMLLDLIKYLVNQNLTCVVLCAVIGRYWAHDPWLTNNAIGNN